MRLSAETRVAEPADLWDGVLHVVDGVWTHAGKPLFVQGAIGDAGRAHPPKAGLGPDPARWPAELDAAGLAGAVLYPSVAHRLFGALRGDTLRAALARYNDWVLPHASARIKPLALLDVSDPVAAAAEVPRLAERGAAGFLLPMVPSRGELGYECERYEPLWRAIAAAGLPVSISAGGLYLGEHVGTSVTLYSMGDDDPMYGWIHAATEVCAARVVVFALVLSGVCDKFPGVKLCVAGFDASWLPYTMIRADEQYETRPERVGTPDKANTVATFEQFGLSQEREGFSFPKGVVPSDRMGSNVFVTFHDDPVAVRLRDRIGVANLLWGSDGAPPPARSFGGLADKDARRLLADNTARLYGFAT
jgi:predicted TIM-barrel fold metal-dependent hydrolase